jgi:hypothetical protein
MKGFDDVLLFSVKPKYVENNKYSKKREQEFTCSKLCSNNTAPLMCLHSHPYLLEGGGCMT